MSGKFPAMQAFPAMNLEQFQRLLANHGCSHLLVKRMATNDNSRNQIYLGGGFEALNQIPMTDIERDSSVQAGSRRDRFKSLVDFHWIAEDGRLVPSPFANLILYPRYPEVRLSGILRGVPRGRYNGLVASREPDRLLALGVCRDERVLGWIGRSGEGLGNELENLILTDNPPVEGVFFRIAVRPHDRRSEEIFARLLEIHRAGWIESKRLDSRGRILPCRSRNCGGYTLEAELGVRPNSRSEPDYDGWEVKQFSVGNLEEPRGGAITLMTPEPDGGLYRDLGLVEFVRRFGYRDNAGRPDRFNFGGIHRYGRIANATGLTLGLEGYDMESRRMERTDGCIALTLRCGEVAASWSFRALLVHWNRKHARAVYVPSVVRRGPGWQYRFGGSVFVGIGTDFLRFLQGVGDGVVYYDPGIKVEQAHSARPLTKKRSQFRVAFNNLGRLYRCYSRRELAGPSETSR